MSEDIESVRERILQTSLRLVNRLSQLIRDVNHWNDHVRKPGDERIDIGQEQLARVIEYHQLVIAKAKNYEPIPSFAGDMDKLISELP
jgi:PHP family Zn ribbon phosphoesterase